jgi:hypothetical protein
VVLSVELSDDGVYPAPLVRGNTEILGHMMALRWRKMWRDDRESVIYLII